jgi:hypothetical protein
VLDGVAAAAADADHLDDRAFLRVLVDDFEHGVLLSFGVQRCVGVGQMN